MAFKNTMITAGISVLGTIAVGGVKALQDLTIVAPAPVYSAPQPPPTTIDWLWWQVIWWLIPAAVVVFVAGIGWSLFNRPEKRQRKSDDGGQSRMNQIIAATRLASTAAATMPEPKKIHWLTQVEAIEQSKPRSWIIGQATEKQPNQEHARQAVGNLLTVDYQTTQFAILGGSGGGKTSSTGMLMLVHAKLTGLHPIVLDGKDGLDWGPLGDAGIVEWYKMDETNLAGYLGQLINIYDKRHAVMRKFGVSKIYDLPKTNYIQPLFVILEEFGSTWEASGNDPEIEKKFNFLSRMGRAAGIILCPIDQTPSAWSKAMRGNAKFACCYNTNGKALGAFDEYHVHELPLYGTFSRGNVFYKAWHTAKEWNVGAMAPIQRRYLVVEGGQKDTVPAVPEPFIENGYKNERLQVVETPINALNVPVSDFNDTLEIPPSLERSFMRLRKWDDFCKKFFDVYPQATQAQLRKVMSKLDGREPDTFKTEAFKWFHCYSPNGDTSRVAGKYGVVDNMKLS